MTTIVVATTFPGMHAWPDAPDEVAFLRFPHRHLFHVKAEIEVLHDDRELEFFMVQRVMRLWLAGLPFDLGARSCETIARDLLAVLARQYGERSYLVEVSEDGENGARVSGGTK